jgi:hypothetical protein
MMNKKAFEMSIGMIVIIILSVLIFSMSLYFVFKWFGSAEELKAEIDKQTKEQIMSALQTGNQLVAIPLAIQQAKRGTSANFGIGVRNIAAEKKFAMAVSFSGAYLPDGKEIACDDQCKAYIEEHWIGGFASSDMGLVKKNEQKVFPFLIKADLNIVQGKSTPNGDYIFNVCVYVLENDVSPAPCSIGQFSQSSAVFYTGKIYQVTVKVV